VEAHRARLGFHAEWVDDAPGLVLGRIVCQLVNEAWFAVGEGVGSEEDVDAGLVLGLAYPRGSIEWGRSIGVEREERYRAAPLVRRAALALGLKRPYAARGVAAGR
jgi:3-hydroxybutyryl-CoA dehydrogenase